MNFSTIQKTQSNVLDYIKSNVSITEVAHKLPGVQLKRSGRLLEGNCPTNHSSKSGTCFKIFPQTNSCHCFNCGRGGTVIDLVMMAQNVQFNEAIKWIIKNFQLDKKFDLTNLKFPHKTEEELRKEAEIRQKNILFEEIVSYGRQLLYENAGKDALNYLTQERKYEIEILKNTEFIYFPKENEVKNYLLSLYPDAEEAIKTLKLTGHFGDSFRLAFPYRNYEGLITGLLKRSTLPKGENIHTYDGKDHNEVRWDSTPGTSKEDLFGLSDCKNEETLVIVEGYPDALYLSKSGINNIVAVGQGRLSEKHLNNLVRSAVKNVIISFDNDSVGPKNTAAAVKLILEKTGIVPYVLNPKSLTPHKDPDEYVRANGVDNFKDLLKKTVKGLFWIMFEIIDKMDKEDPLSKQATTNELFSLSKMIKDPVEMEEFRKLVAKQLNISDSSIKARIKTEIDNSRIELYKKYKDKTETGSNRYVPFIEKSTSSYAYYDYKEDEHYLGVPYQILENIMASAEQVLPEVLPVLKADFYVQDNNRIDYEKERFNFFVPTEHMLLNKTEEKINPRNNFPHTYNLLSNLLPNYQERKLFLNWLAGILQLRKKHITAWLLKGSQGTGKNVLVDKVLKPIFGQKQTKIVDDADLKRDWNPWLQNALLIAFNEVAHDNNSRNFINSKIKSIITDTTATINEKNVKTYTVTNHANCLFFSNETIPLFIEQGDRRFNVIKTGEKLTSFEWFNKDPEEFLKKLEDEVPLFAQFLMNWVYDSKKANTCINNDEKEKIVGVCMDRFEEFSHKLKQADIEWFKAGINNMFGLNITIPEEDIKIGRIEKDTATKLFNEIYSDHPIKKEALSKKLNLYGITPSRDKTNGLNLYLWKI